VKIDTGSLSGLATTGGVTAYLGIPFAAPPVGELRWRPPQPAAKWEAVRKADKFGTSCMQNQAGSRLPWTEEFMTQGPIGEDCLFLNVWTAAKNANARLPVMFWIYGGGFNEGSSSVAVYNGTELAKKGVIVVSVNYRVGPLGFLAHPELTKESPHRSSGNYGLLDQIAALQWVSRNIAAFGGDPNQVTIFGQSAGALSVMHLMRSPLAKGLFARAIAQSGPGLLGRNALGGGATLADREAAGAKYIESKGAKTLAEMRALPAAGFFASGGRGGVTVPNSPFTDGWVLPATQPAEQVPLILGFTADDIGVGGGGFGAAAKPGVASYQSDAQRNYADQAATFLWHRRPRGAIARACRWMPGRQNSTRPAAASTPTSSIDRSRGRPILNSGRFTRVKCRTFSEQSTGSIARGSRWIARSPIRCRRIGPISPGRVIQTARAWRAGRSTCRAATSRCNWEPGSAR